VREIYHLVYMDRVCGHMASDMNNPNTNRKLRIGINIATFHIL
jgi:hypothetical protein